MHWASFLYIPRAVGYVRRGFNSMFTKSHEANRHEESFNIVKALDEDARLMANTSLATQPNHVTNRKKSVRLSEFVFHGLQISYGH